jgi:alkylation response protein AidB-like acyl-CoA dehydrogenase
MDFDDSPADAEFRTVARGWLDQNAPKELEPALTQAGFGELVLNEMDVLTASRRWQKRKAAAGWACPHWPREYGGRGLTPIEQVIWQQEEGVYGRLATPFIVGHGMCGPTLMTHAREDDRRRYLPPIASGEEIWCQLFSEPGAGSDLAGISTRAVADADAWVVNGQKVWTSFAHLSDFGLLLARTDPAVPKHRGLTMFFVDMHARGVEVRPIKQANGQHGFNEVFFSDVRIPDRQRLGGVGDGWRVALTTLMNERLAIGSGMPTGFEEIFQWCISLHQSGARVFDDRAVRARLATWAARRNGLKYTAARAITALSRGATPGPENSIGKLVAGSTMQEIAEFALGLAGALGVVNDPDAAADGGRFQAMLLRAPATRLEGGTDEILRNIIAERVLGLPPDIRLDKDVPFNRIPSRSERLQ